MNESTKKEIIILSSTDSRKRTKIFNRELGYLLDSIQEMKIFLNEQNDTLRHEILIEIANYINYKKFQKGSIIKYICEDDHLFYITISGKILKIDINYKKCYAPFKDYILFLTRLYLLNEKRLVNECLSINNEVIPIPLDTDIIELGKSIKDFDFEDELKKIEEQIKIFMKNKEEYDIDNLLKLRNPNFDIKEKLIKSDCNFPFYLPTSLKDKVLEKHSFLGDLTKPKGVKKYSSYLCLEDVCCLYIDKNNIPENSKLYELYDLTNRKIIIQKIFNGNFVFKNISKDYLIKYLGQNFKRILMSKNQILLSQGKPNEGIFFISEGNFEIKTIKSYNELNELYLSLKIHLNSPINKILKFSKNEGENETNILFNDLIKNDPSFIKKVAEEQDISLCTYNGQDIIGLKEFYDSKTGVSHFDVKCTSDYGEVYFLPNALMTSLLSNDEINEKITDYSNEKTKCLMKEINDYQKFFIKRFQSMSVYRPKTNMKKLLLHKNYKLKINDNKNSIKSNIKIKINYPAVNTFNGKNSENLTKLGGNKLKNQKTKSYNKIILSSISFENNKSNNIREENNNNKVLNTENNLKIKINKRKSSNALSYKKFNRNFLDQNSSYFKSSNRTTIKLNNCYSKNNCICVTDVYKKCDLPVINIYKFGNTPLVRNKLNYLSPNKIVNKSKDKSSNETKTDFRNSFQYLFGDKKNKFI